MEREVGGGIGMGKTCKLKKNNNNNKKNYQIKKNKKKKKEKEFTLFCPSILFLFRSLCLFHRL